MSAQTTSILSPEVQTYYETKFLERAQYELIHAEGSQKRSLPDNSGKTLRFTRYTPLAIASTPLTEGTNPAEVALTNANVDAVLAEYGTTVKVSKLLSLVSIDRNGAEKASVLGQNMGETLDYLAREELFGGATVQLAAARAALTDVASTDVMTVNEIRKAVRTLELNKAIAYEDGFYLGKLQANTKFDFTKDTTWLAAKQYSDVKDLYNGELGQMLQVRLLSAKNGRTEASTVTVYSNFFHGKESFGTFDLASDSPKLYIKTPDAHSTDNPADRFMTMAWAGAYVAKSLNGSWIINVKTAASA